MSDSGTEAEMGSGSEQRTVPGRFPGRLVKAMTMAAILLAMTRWVIPPEKRSQRGVTTVEYIFGALIGIAIVGCIAALFASGAMDTVAEGVMKWIFGQRPSTGG